MCLLDMLPNYHVWTSANKNWAMNSWHWLFMAQPEPFPETLMSAVPAEWFLKSRSGSRNPPKVVYDEYIRPALDAAGLEPFRADEERRAGHIITDMFQELLVADLVVADLTIENPNVWYELGVRHALRARGVVIVCGGRVPSAFDVYTDRKLRYVLKQGAPDPVHLEDDKRKLVEMVAATMDAWAGMLGAGAGVVDAGQVVYGDDGAQLADHAGVGD